MRIILKADSETSQRVEVTITNDDNLDNSNYVDLLLTDLETKVTTDARIMVADLYAALRIFEERRLENLAEQRHYDALQGHQQSK